MELNEMTVTEEVIETAEEVAKAADKNGWKTAGTIGLCILGCLAAYRFIARPVISKVKTKIRQKHEMNSADGADVIIDVEATEVTEE